MLADSNGVMYRNKVLIAICDHVILKAEMEKKIPVPYFSPVLVLKSYLNDCFQV